MPIPGSSLSIFDIAGSAMTAQSQRMNVTASNLANADSVTGPDGKPYRARQVVFEMSEKKVPNAVGLPEAVKACRDTRILRAWAEKLARVIRTMHDRGVSALR